MSDSALVTVLSDDVPAGLLWAFFFFPVQVARFIKGEAADCWFWHNITWQPQFPQDLHVCLLPDGPVVISWSLVCGQVLLPDYRLESRRVSGIRPVCGLCGRLVFRSGLLSVCCCSLCVDSCYNPVCQCLRADRTRPPNLTTDSIVSPQHRWS